MIRKWLVGLLALWCFITSIQVGAAEIPERNGAAVVDETGVLSQTTKDYITNVNEVLASSPEQYQIAVYFPKSLGSFDSIEQLANEVARAWKVGYQNTNNGILLVVMPEQRKMRIETSNRAATVLTDVEAKRALDAAKPLLRDRDYDGAVKLITGKVMQQLSLTPELLAKVQAVEGAVAKSARKSTNWFQKLKLGERIMQLIVVIGICSLGTRRRRGSFSWGPFATIWTLMGLSSGRRHRHTTYWDDDDDDDWFGGSSSGGSSSGGSSWGGSGFGGGGASSGW